MPPEYPQVLDEARLRRAENLLCDIFGVQSLRKHQKLAGNNILRGKTTVYDVPTGGGKTLAFWYPLFYDWDDRDMISTSQNVVLVVSPLNALMNSQAEALQEKGIPALAVNSEGSKIEDIFEVYDNTHRYHLKHRVLFVSPETALSTQFHEKVLKIKSFRVNCMELVIDESHSASEWGEDFRPEYAELGKLLARLPSGLPVLLASATMPENVIHDVLFKVGLPQDSARVAVSNAKHNVALSVRILQHPSNTYADLLALFPTEKNGGFRQTLIYVNSQSEAEEIQDFLRRNCPEHISTDAIEFYHRNLTDKRKRNIQEGLRTGRLCCVIATDALGMVCHFCH
ncbi:P-loop containing nucleoside triphosphate hydrolase protein [Lentinula edodes]|uniref:P-loop containing nucleoside triphosphate hydrolase protein n=1 Tax=Lentinula edodes TaxID=5353 RepID=UPI001E8ECA8C|nr:P-loop containing nucleoside triphosphate hydrolase protein [Lentinula edodes]KAH7869376.1 P-loop containing nucleoside triphosphate hydrolase protein [Lentinula edodes]